MQNSKTFFESNLFHKLSINLLGEIIEIMSLINNFLQPLYLLIVEKHLFNIFFKYIFGFWLCN